MKNSINIVAVVCALSLITGAQAECCRKSLTLFYSIASGNCADAGGRTINFTCTITICADGRAQQGTYCGKGSCNIFGCACGGGCLQGNFKDSFLANNQNRGIVIGPGERWNS